MMGRNDPSVLPKSSPIKVLPTKPFTKALQKNRLPKAPSSPPKKIMIRIGISPCPNDVFIFAGWLLGKTSAPRATFAFEDVQTLNAQARAGGYDLVKVSYANVPACTGYELLDCGGALGRGCGPLLLTGGAAWDPERVVLVPGEYTTANFLLDFWMRHGGWRTGGKTENAGSARPVNKRFLPFDALYRTLQDDSTAQGVVIHEMRFTYADDGLRLVADLGAAWEAETGMPIPLGTLLRRRDEAGNAPPRAVLEEAVRASLAWAWAHEDEALALCARHAQDMTPAVMRAHIDLYVNSFTHDLGREGRAAVDFFFRQLRAG